MTGVPVPLRTASRLGAECEHETMKKRKLTAQERPHASRPQSGIGEDTRHESREDLEMLQTDEPDLEDKGESPKSILEKQVQMARETLPKAGAQWRWLLTRLDAGELQLAITGLETAWEQETAEQIELGIVPGTDPRAQIEALPKRERALAFFFLGHWLAVDHAMRIAFLEGRAGTNLSEALQKAKVLAWIGEIAESNAIAEQLLERGVTSNAIRLGFEDTLARGRQIVERVPPREIEDLRARVRKAIRYLAGVPFLDWMPQLLRCGIEGFQSFAAYTLGGDLSNHFARYPSRDWPKNLDAELPGAIFEASKNVKGTNRRKLLRVAEKLVAPRKKDERKAKRALKNRALARRKFEDADRAREEVLDEWRAMASARLGRLTEKERQVFELSSAGLDDAEIAGHMRCTQASVRARKSRLFRKLRTA